MGELLRKYFTEYVTTSHYPATVDNFSLNIFIRSIQRDGILEVPVVLNTPNKVFSFRTTTGLKYYGARPTFTIKQAARVDRLSRGGNLVSIFSKNSRDSYNTDAYKLGYGVLLKDNRILFICTIQYLGDNVYRPVLRVSPEVFYSDGVFERWIAKTLIKEAATTNINQVKAHNSKYPLTLGSTITVIVENCNEFIVTPTIPTPSLVSNESISNFIQNNIDNLFNED
ncbi:MAG: hypothetical protein ACI398_04155 [Clostridium sp.]